MHTTPPPPFDVAAALPPVAPYARTTVRLHPRPGAPTAAQSSMGGPLLWPAEEPWPACDGPAGAEHLDGTDVVPVVPVLQLYAADVPELPFPDGADVLQVLWCPSDHDPWTSPLPRLFWRDSAAVTGPLATAPASDPEADGERRPDTCVLDPERVLEYPDWDLPDAARDEIRDAIRALARDTGWEYDHDLATASGTKVGGYPGWTQLPDWPECACGRRMEHLLTVASWEFSNGYERRWITVEDRPAMAGWGFDAAPDHPWRRLQNPAGIMLGDAGGIYLFVCLACPGRPYEYRFDCG
ncbi:hypothetical protein [Dactylosporangium darangshiense]|uniref:DUF1963 domain-containing protein n=1 Tax=Dactylosporangium darangshiense TaxID=579108 RepID=A0ABP8DN52_9ACTN